MNRIQGILAAGTLTLVMVGAIVAFGRFNPASAENTTAPTSAPDMTQIDAQQDQLQQELDLMQQREAEYAAQIEAANDTIAQLMADQTSGSTAEPAQISDAQQTIAELQASLAVMQQREQQYAAQIEAANQSILTLQSYINENNAAVAGGSATAPSYESDEHDEYDDDGDHDEEYEHEDDDHEEHDDD